MDQTNPDPSEREMMYKSPGHKIHEVREHISHAIDYLDITDILSFSSCYTNIEKKKKLRAYVADELQKRVITQQTKTVGYFEV